MLKPPNNATLILQVSFKTQGNKQAHSENFIPTQTCIVHVRHLRSHNWHLSTCPSLVTKLVPRRKQMGVKSLYQRSGSLLHVGVCFKSFDSRELIKWTEQIYITGTDIVNRTCDCLRRCGWVVRFMGPSLQSRSRPQ